MGRYHVINSMKSFFRVWCLTLNLLAAARPAHAWNPPGHMLVASIAYDQLTPPQRAHLLTILEAHPDFTKWQAAAPKDVPGFDFGRYVFMHASTWPDDIRKSGSPYDHPPWHHVDFPLTPPGFPLEEPPATENLLTTMAYGEKMVVDPGASATDRAAYLSWVMHLVGDVMQPLHGGTRIDADHPKPDGDHNGGLFFVNVGGNDMNLHWYWDCLGVTTPDARELIARGAELEKTYPRASLPELATMKDVRGWALESRQLAIDAVYLKGTLPGGYDDKAVLPALPGDYAAAGRRVAERRLVLAGYRLADELTRLKL